MKQSKYFLLLFVTVVCFSCKKDFLDVADKNVIQRQEYVKDLKSSAEFLNGIYISFTQYVYTGYNQIYPDLIADNIRPVSAQSTYLAPQYYWKQQTSAGNMNDLWTKGYQVIHSCSFLIETIDKYKEEDATQAADIKGQAYALRAFIHFMLANIFAQSPNFTSDASHVGVPYITTSDWTQPVTRQKVGEDYDYMVSDLNAAIDVLPEVPVTVASANRNLVMNKNAAKALLARVLLFKGDYNEAKNVALSVMKSVPIMPASATGYPSKLFTAQETEALFQLYPSSPSVGGGTFFTAFQGSFFTGTTSQIQFSATKDIVNALTENPQDVRKGWVTTGGTITKYPVNVIAGFNPTSNSYYQTILRSSEMYLTVAECLSNLNKDDSARIYLDSIRKRANPISLPSTAVGSALRDSIYKERRKELAFEGIRMFDLLRWKKGVVRTDSWTTDAQNLPYPSNKAIAPIPAIDVDLTHIPQNSDY